MFLEGLFEASDIVDFTERSSRRMQELLPKLVWRLMEEIGAQNCSFPSGEHISKPGYDGECCFYYSEMRGMSAVFEMGTNKEIKAKFKEDLEKRTKESLAYEKSETIFYFITSRKFPNAEQVRQESKENTPWKDVIIWDVDRLYTEIQKNFFITLWCARIFNKLPENISSLEEEVNHWLEIDKKKGEEERLPYHILLASRDENREAFKDNASFKGETRHEAMAFIYAVLKEKKYSVENALLIKSKEAFDSLVTYIENRKNKTPPDRDNILVLAPQEGGFPESGKVAVLRNKGWNIFYALGAEDRDFQIEDKYSLSQPLNHDLSSILLNFLKDPSQIGYMLSKAGRSLPYLLENLRSSPSQWFAAFQEYLKNSPEILCCAALMGRWNNEKQRDGTYRYQDNKIFQKLTGKSWEERESLFLQLSQIKRLDAPLIRLKTDIWSQETWFVRSQLSFINCVKGSFPESLLNKFEEICEEILITQAPLYSKDVKEGVLKTLEIFGRADLGDLGKDLKRRAEKIARMNIRKLAFLYGKDVKERIAIKLEFLENFLGSSKNGVEKFLRMDIENLLSPYQKIYFSFSEIAPESFLESLEEDFKQKNNFIKYNRELVFALRKIAWEEKYFSRSAELLRQYFTLKEKERDYKPMIRHEEQEALIALFKFECPQTYASSQKRKQKLKIWAKEYPKFVKELLLKLICHIREPIIVFPKSPYLEEKENLPTVQEVQEQYFWAIDFLLSKIEEGTEEEQENDWCRLLQKWSLLGSWSHPQEVPALEKCAEKRGAKAVLLRKEIERIKASFSAAFNIDFLEKTSQFIQPKTAKERLYWFFSLYLLPPEEGEAGEARARYNENIRQEQRKTLEDFIREGGSEEEIREFIENSPSMMKSFLCPDKDSIALFIEVTGEKYLKAIFTTEMIGIPSFRGCFLEQLHKQQKAQHLDPQNFVKFYLEKAQKEEWGERAYARFMQALTIDKKLWEKMGQYSEVFWQEYFEHFSLCNIRLNQVPFEEIFLKLLEHKKSDKVFYAVFSYIFIEKSQENFIKFPAYRAVKFLKEHADSLKKMRAEDIGRYLRDILPWLDQQKTSLEDLVYLEREFKEQINYSIPLSCGENKRGFKSIFEKFAQDPEFFCDYVKEIFGLTLSFGSFLPSYKRPGMNEKGEIKTESLLAWIIKVREISQEKGFLERADYILGELFSFYPLESIALIFEEIESKEIEDGFIYAIKDKDGVSEFYSAADDAHSLEKYYLSKANEFEDDYPRFAHLLRKIAKSFEDDVEYHKYEVENFDMKGRY